MLLGTYYNNVFGENKMEQICNEPRYYKSQQLCQMMGISSLTLRNWTKLGKIPKPVRIGATSLFEKEVFDRFLKEGGTPS